MISNMSERMERYSPEPEKVIVRQETEVGHQPNESGETVKWLAETRDMLQEMKEDPIVKEGVEPALRTAINTAIAVVDLFPGIGEVTSWGADAAKIWAQYEYKKNRREAEEKGEDPDEVKLSPIDLTPDVSTSVAVLTELIEPFTAGFFPSHAIEGGLQLRVDWPKLKAAAKRLREIYNENSSVSEDEQQAGKVFDVDFKDIN